MRLSDAVLLGATMAKPGEMSGGYLKCGLSHEGGAELHWEHADYVWPWVRLDQHGSEIIGKWDHEYLKGKMSFEAFVDWLHSVEPQEKGPSLVGESPGLSQHDAALLPCGHCSTNEGDA